MKIRTGLINNEFVYETINQWPDTAKAQAGGGPIDSMGEMTFFEVFIEGISYIRGEGTDIKSAENKAWAIYQHYQNCNHSFERFGDYSTMGKCNHCGMKKEKEFVRLTKCSVCEAAGVAHNISSTYFCYTHYKEALTEFTQEQARNHEAFSGEQKWLWANEVAESNGLYENKDDGEISELFRALYSGFFEYMMDVCRHYHKKFEIEPKKHFVDIYDAIEMNETAYKMAFEFYIAKNKNITINKELTENQHFIEKFIKNY